MPEADIASSWPPLINSTGGVALSRFGLAVYARDSFYASRAVHKTY